MSSISLETSSIRLSSKSKSSKSPGFLTEWFNSMSDLAKDTILRLMDSNKDYLMGVDPEKNFLPLRAEFFEKAAKWLKEKTEEF